MPEEFFDPQLLRPSDLPCEQWELLDAELAKWTTKRAELLGYSRASIDQLLRYGSTKPQSEEEKAKKAEELQRIDHIIQTLQKIRGEYEE
jgi:hypothetical protein